MANAKQQVDAEVVKLRQAKKVGQVVSGSSSTSRYVCVAVGKQLNMAARVQGNSLSIRIEPWEKHETALVAAKMQLASLGITVHDNGNYASVHFSGDDQVKALMGAASFAMGFILINGGVVMPLDEMRDALLGTVSA